MKPLLLALLLIAAAAVPAAAIPIRGITVASEPGLRATVSATLYSPPGADGCGATYLIQIRSSDGDYVYKQARGRVNVCRDGDGTGWTRGEVRRRFYMGDVEPDVRYLICVVARQPVNGVVSRHGACRYRAIARRL
jgi:hypothetical protein